MTITELLNKRAKTWEAAKQSPPGELIQTVMLPVPSSSSDLKRAGVTSSSNQLSSAITPSRYKVRVSFSFGSGLLFFVHLQNFFCRFIGILLVFRISRSRIGKLHDIAV